MFRKVIKIVSKKINTLLFKRRWKKQNPHNYTSVAKVFPKGKVIIGKGTYGVIDADFYGNEEEYLEIGNYCSIAGNVKFLTGGGHKYTCLSTFPFKKYYSNFPEVEAITKGSIIVKDDVWIGHGTIILSGVTIGQGAVIGAGSIVTKDIDPYSIYAGGRVIRKRFSNDIIEKLQRLDYSKISSSDIKSNLELINRDIDENFFFSEFYKSNLKENE